MNTVVNKTIYEIYAGCRLCGSGSGYKMPIIRNIPELQIAGETEEIEFRVKISECLQIEVYEDDRMPPLICELCADKVDEFYQFFKMTHQTNKRIRQRLGLPLQTYRRGGTSSSETSNCILGVTEKVCVNSDSEGEPLSKQATPLSRKNKSAKLYAEAKIKPEPEPEPKRHAAPERRAKRPRSPHRRGTEERSVFDLLQDDLDSLQNKPTPRKLSKKEKKIERRKERELRKQEKGEQQTEDLEDSPKSTMSKRTRASSIDSNYTPVKRVKLLLENDLEESAELSPGYCKICKRDSRTLYNLNRHNRKHHLELVDDATPESSKEDVKKPGPKSKTIEKSQPKLQLASTKLQSATPKTKTKPETIAQESTKSKQDSKFKKGDKRIEDSPLTEKKRNEEVKVKKKEEIFKCVVCGLNCGRNYQKLTAHNLKMHVPSFTPLSHACNPCEKWFPTAKEAESHHGEHCPDVPYTCNKCYDDFVTLELYDLHFIKNQCLLTYEVPDVKCDECWKTFPTEKLLEDHRCLGEAARPGGNCSKCGKRYCLLKNQIIHEMKCNGRKPVEPTEPIASEMLPMHVRLVRCDDLLKPLTNGSYDVSSVPHTFGLDGNYNYPYFYSKGAYGMKIEPIINFDHMVSIKDEIKEEFLRNDFVHWDSDDENADQNTSSNASRKTVEPLTILSLKTLFSPKCLGKVPRKRKLLSEKPFDSILSIKFSDDIRRNIDKIINNLETDANSDSYDSDSVLGKTKPDVDKNDTVDDLRNLGNNVNSVHKDIVNNGSKDEINNSSACDDEPFSLNKNDDVTNSSDVDKRSNEGDSCPSDSKEKDNRNLTAEDKSDVGITCDSTKGFNNIRSFDLDSSNSTQDSNTDCNKSEDVVNEAFTNKDITDTFGISDKTFAASNINIENQPSVLDSQNSTHLNTDEDKSKDDLDNKANVDNTKLSHLEVKTPNDIHSLEHCNKINSDSIEAESNSEDKEDGTAENTNPVSTGNEVDNHSSCANSECDSEAPKISINDMNADDVSLNSLKDSVTSSDIFDINIRNEQFTDDETKQLMDELDEQIGESRFHRNDNDRQNHNDSDTRNDGQEKGIGTENDVGNGKNISLFNLVQKSKDDLKSLDLDVVSDDEIEFGL